MIKKKNHKKLYTALFLLLIASVVFGVFYLFSAKEKSEKESSRDVSIVNIQEEGEKSGKLKEFNGKEFKELFFGFAHPNTSKINENTPISGHPVADEYLKDLAKKRGYTIQSAPIVDNFVEVEKGMFLQQLAAKDWERIKTAAKNEGLQFSLLDGLRSSVEQKQIFLERLGSVEADEVVKGIYDTKIDQILKTTALPGFSRHHSGYTIDIACASEPNSTFENSSCFAWLSSDNYKNAKTYGFIPSFPDGAGRQGPDPEAWEYIWVGKEALTE